MDRSVQRRTKGFDETWTVSGREAKLNGWGELVLFHDDLERCTVTDLQAALRESCAEGEGLDVARITDVDYEFYDEDSSGSEAISFKLHNNALTILLSFVFSDEDDRNSCQVVRSTLQPLLRRHRMAILECRPGEWVTQAPVQFVDTLIGFSTRGRTLRELYDMGNDALALVDAIASGELTRTTLGDLIRAGHASVLIGQEEGHWLEVKGQHYDLHTKSGKIKLASLGKIELAQAVSRFCNSEDGGLVVVGMSTKKVPGGEEIRALQSVPRNRSMVGLYKQAIEDHLHPPPDNLRIEAIDAQDDGMLILIDIPPQPEELKPFLVHGAIVDGKVEGAFISIVRRRGEGSIPITAPMIHSMLAAGRALLRREELPRDS